ncbi:predicted GPI-anchored protein 37 [Impatiens glandulifera]|uniref:predicted GPI-anchored protein 37 n=1 Tax=Impatiens glandulifera TaxID=253017 RepID=UPI001FB0FED6|nr:predicted GPI-anchored protein 37 [Impatiens glandulifera]
MEIDKLLNVADAERLNEADAVARRFQDEENVVVEASKQPIDIDDSNNMTLQEIANQDNLVLEKNIISHEDDNVKKGQRSSRGGGNSKGGGSSRGDVSTDTRSKRKLTDEGSCRPTKRGGSRSGDHGGGSGGNSGCGGRSLPPFRNLLSGEGFNYPIVKREDQ